MEIFIVWIVFTCIVAVLGDQRIIGSFKAFFISILLSPLIGLIFVLTSKRKDTAAFEKAVFNKVNNNTTSNFIDDMYKLKLLYDAGNIDEDAYQSERNRINATRVAEHTVYIFDSLDRKYLIDVNISRKYVSVPNNREGALKFNINHDELKISLIKKSIFFSAKHFAVAIPKHEFYCDLAKIL